MKKHIKQIYRQAAGLCSHIMIAAASFLLPRGQAYAQTKIIKDTTIYNGNIPYNGTIKIQPTTVISPGAGQRAHIFALPVFCASLSPAFSAAQNYVLTAVPRVAGYNPATTGYSTCDVMQTVQYIDGLGRPIQTVQVKGNPNATRDVVQPLAYDQFGREAVKYLPYTTASNDGSYKTDALTTGAGQAAFYASPPVGSGVSVIPHPSAETGFEPSPLNRVAEQGAPGTPWQLSTSGISGSGHTVKTEYGTNDASSLTSGSGRWAKMYYVSIDSNRRPSLIDGGSYGNNQLYVIISKDENWKSSDGKAGTTEEYIDKKGRTILKRSFNTTTDIISTYFVFNDLGNLTYVLSPKSEPDNGSISQATLDQLCFQYLYDGRGRIIENKVPGKGRDFIVYNNLDQSVASQDSMQRLNNQWSFTKYDGIGRVVVSGIWNNNNVSISRLNLQSQINSQTVNWENRDNSNAGNKYYTSLSFPTNNIITYLAVNYYDDYIIPNLPTDYDQHTSYSSMTTGLQTAALTNVIGTTDLLWTANYYDDKGHVVKKIVQHYLNGGYNLANYDETSFEYNFIDDVIAKTRIHHTSNNPVLTIANTYDFDHVGRETKIGEQINNGVKVLLSQSDYNDIGQVKTQHLHSINNGNSFFQDIGQRYNERGWLAKDSSGLFVMQLKYNDGTNPMYNGNISDQYWGTGNSLTKNYTYNYDKLNRLTTGISNEGFNEQVIDYDKIGNIKHLTRVNPPTSVTDSFVYNYNGNQLSTITGLTGITNYLYDGNGNTVYDARNGTTNTYNFLNLPNTLIGSGKNISYTYDAAGNKLRRVSPVTGSTDYIDGIQYDNGQISFILTEHGRILVSGSNYNYEYNIGDKLGNSRVTFDTQSGVANKVQQDDYYPFGTEISRSSIVSPKNLYLYNKMELQEELGQYDYGKRFYDPLIGRFTTIDPLAEKYPYYTPYQFAGNEVPNAMDMDGLEPAYQEKNGRTVIGRDGQLQRPLTNADGKAQLLSNVQSGGGIFSLRNPMHDIIGILASVGEPINVLISGKNSNGTPATTKDKIGATLGIITSIPMEGGEGGKLGSTELSLKEGDAPIEPKLGSSDGPGAGKRFSKTTKAVAKAETNGICVFCGEKTDTGIPGKKANTDHAIPKVQGGNNTIDNAQHTCQSCNLEKGPKTTQEYLKYKETKNKEAN